MANILNIDSSSPRCSVSISIDGETIVGYESGETMDHSRTLATYAVKCIKFADEKGIKLEAVSVSNGPGSYTGLRIGLSLAKGICYGRNIPLITLSTLEVLAVRAMFSYEGLEGDEIIVPMVDARRMEVFTGAFNCRLEEVAESGPRILNEEAFAELASKPKILFIGTGTEKFKPLYAGENGEWLGEETSHAKFMAVLSEKHYREGKFADIAYSTPFYLKEYQTTKPKNKVI
ncbi:MAG: tRNA (adenosine(37)-N6)-threonylcarbamoyltransferase complex dimerization subunit type 1 TsaB [Muribaculaceae bacterium]|nr:tRNA (adenosine(37)-N6)-threonylcarbamoyltransferase complex dimerization subunit type 1 TsaB [Muribaculaceae bacterium]